MPRVSQRKIIWFGLAASTFIYAAVLWSVARTWPEPAQPFEAAVQQTAVLVLYVLALLDFILAHVLPRRMADHRARFTARVALFASCAIYGLVAAFITQDWRLYLPAWALAMIG